MHRRLALLWILVFAGAAASPPSPEERAAFDAGDARYRAHKLGDACRELSVFILKYPASELLRLARAERADACLSAGAAEDQQRSYAELRQLSEPGTDDWARALAASTLVSHGDRALAGDANGRARAALALLITFSREGDPHAAEARERLVSLGLQELRLQRLGDSDAIAVRLLAADLTADQKALVTRFRDSARLDKQEVAVLTAGQQAAARGDFARALELYGQGVELEGARVATFRSAIAQLQQPSLALTTSYLELPGGKPEAVVTFRNLDQVTLTLSRFDPTGGTAKAYFAETADATHGGRRLAVVRSWKLPLKVPAPYAPGTQTLALEVPGPGVYALDAVAGSLSAVALLHVTPLAAVVKVAPREALVWLADAMTSQAVGGGRAVAFVQVETENQPLSSKVEAACDASGLCRLPLPPRAGRVEVWAGKGDAWTYTLGTGDSWEPESREQLAWILTDRPLYKPGEKVGVKLFVRTRGNGPSRPVVGKPLRLITSAPDGTELDRRTVRPSAFGTASFELQLKKDAPLGGYQVTLENAIETDETYVNAGGGTFSVEEYKPPEYAVTVEPVGAPKPGEPVKVRISAALYAGGPVANAEGVATVSFGSYSHAFPAWPGEDDEEYGCLGCGPFGDQYLGGRPAGGIGSIGNPSRRPNVRPAPKSCFTWQSRTIPFRTGEDGTVELEVEGACEQVPDHSVSVSVLVTDLSRREVEGSGSINVSSEPWFVDLRTDRFVYKPGERIKVTLRSEDANGRPTSPAVQLRVVRIEEKDSPEVQRKDVTVTGGTVEVQLDADALGPVRVEVRPQGADVKEVEPLATADAWLSSDTRPLIPPWNGMFIVTDQRPTPAGSTLRALVVASRPGGHALVTLEGEKVHAAQVVELRGRARIVELPLTGAMTPGVTLVATRLERLVLESTATDVRVSGAEAPITVKVLPGAASVLPGSAVGVQVKLEGAPAGTPVEVAFTAFDDALTAIVPEEPGNDLMTFFARTSQEPRVQTASSVDTAAFRPLPPEPAPPVSSLERPAYLDATTSLRGRGAGLGAPSKAARASEDAAGVSLGGVPPGTMGGGMSARGAGAPAGQPRPPSAQPAPTTPPGPAAAPPPVRVRGRFSSTAGWVPSAPGALGGAAQLTARFSDSLTRWKLRAYAVSASGHLGVGTATVRTEQPLMVRLEGPRFFTERDEVTLSALVTSRLAKPAAVDVAFEVPGLKALGPTTRRVTVAPGVDARVDVRYAVLAPGKQRFRTTVRAGAAADAMEWTLPARLHGVTARTVFSGALAEKVAFDVTLPEKRNPRGTRLAFTASPSLLGVMLDAVPYLADYPYGCVEQTLSRFLPAVAASRVVHQLGVTSPRVPAQLDDMVKAGLARLKGFQHPDGGWGWWEKDDTNPGMTAYVVFGLALAKESGVGVEPVMVSRGRSWLLGNFKQLSSHDAAFAAFALANSGGAPKEVLDAAFAGRDGLDDRGKAFVALALATAKDPRAQAAADSLRTLREAVHLGVSGGKVDQVWQSCAAVESVALALMAAGRRGDAAAVQELTDFLVLRRQGDRWSTTRDTAFAVYALADVAMGERAKLADGSFEVRVNGKAAAKAAAKAAYRAGGATQEAITLADGAFKPGPNHVEVLHQGGGKGHWSAVFEVLDVEENVRARPSDAVEVKRTYTVLGRPGTEKVAAGLEYGMPIEAGERVRVDLEVKAAKALEYVLIEDPKPAGLEAVAQHSGQEVCGYACTHAELKTDRVAIFQTQLPKGVSRFSYELRAEVPGRFHGLPTRVEAMYAPEVYATGDEMRVEVRDPKRAGEGVAKQ